jgi:V8-like Glu-specific endopeptidase
MGSTRKLRLAAMASAVTLTATVVCAPMAWGATPAAPAAAPTAGDVADATGSEIVSAVAPVLQGKGSKARTYSQQEAQEVDAEGGDPAVLDYWTPERMAAATSLDEPGDSKLVSKMAQDAARSIAADGSAGVGAAALGATAAGADGTIVSEPVAPTGAAAAKASGGVEAQGIKRFPITTGKLFIGGYQGDRYCSASALNTRSKRVVITAGHCVHSGRGGSWLNNVVFVPRYNGYAADPTPYGTFQAHTLHTFKAWINYGGTTRGWGRDVGVISTYRNEKDQRLVKVVGGNGLMISKSYRFTAAIFGYPSNLDSGEVMWVCQGMVGKTQAVPFTSKIVGCNFGGGSSGGPWVWKYDGSKRLGYTRGVTSFGPSNNKFIGSPHFDVKVRSLAIAANNA